MNGKLHKTEVDYDFRHHLRNTIILLGGRKKIADMLTKSIDLALNNTDVESLRRYNVELINTTKDMISSVSTVRVRKNYEA